MPLYSDTAGEPKKRLFRSGRAVFLTFFIIFAAVLAAAAADIFLMTPKNLNEGILAVRQGNFEQAERKFQLVFLHDGEITAAYLDKAAALTAQDDPAPVSACIASLASCQKQLPPGECYRLHSTLTGKAVSLAESGSPAEGLRWMELLTAAEQQLQIQKIFYDHALELIRNGEPDQAQTYLNAAEESRRRFNQSCMEQAISLLQAGQEEQAALYIGCLSGDTDTSEYDRLVQQRQDELAAQEKRKQDSLDAYQEALAFLKQEDFDAAYEAISRIQDTAVRAGLDDCLIQEASSRIASNRYEEAEPYLSLLSPGADTSALARAYLSCIEINLQNNTPESIVLVSDRFVTPDIQAQAEQLFRDKVLALFQEDKISLSLPYQELVVSSAFLRQIQAAALEKAPLLIDRNCLEDAENILSWVTDPSEDSDKLYLALISAYEQNGDFSRADALRELLFDSLPETEISPEPESITEPEPIPDTENVVQAEANPEVQDVPETEAAPEPENITEPEPIPDTENIVQAEANPEVQSVAETEAVPEPEKVSESVVSQPVFSWQPVPEQQIPAGRPALSESDPVYAGAVSKLNSGDVSGLSQDLPLLTPLQLRFCREVWQARLDRLADEKQFAAAVEYIQQIHSACCISYAALDWLPELENAFSAFSLKAGEAAQETGDYNSAIRYFSGAGDAGLAALESVRELCYQQGISEIKSGSFRGDSFAFLAGYRDADSLRLFCREMSKSAGCSLHTAAGYLTEELRQEVVPFSLENQLSGVWFRETEESYEFLSFCQFSWESARFSKTGSNTLQSAGYVSPEDFASRYIWKYPNSLGWDSGQKMFRWDSGSSCRLFAYQEVSGRLSCTSYRGGIPVLDSSSGVYEKLIPCPASGN